LPHCLQVVDERRGHAGGSTVHAPSKTLQNRGGAISTRATRGGRMVRARRLSHRPGMSFQHEPQAEGARA
jgi:hypothetical protein